MAEKERKGRKNYFEVQRYLDYQKHVKQSSQATLKRKWAHLQHLLEWAVAIRFYDTPKLELTFQNYILEARND